MQKRPRTTEESIILSISGAISAGLLAFAIIRIMQADVPVATLNSIAVIVTTSIFLHVYVTNKTNFARWGLSLLSIMVMMTTVYLKGYQQLLWVYPALTTVFFLLTPHLAALLSSLFLATVMAMVLPEITAMYALKFAVSAGATLLFCYAFAFRMRGQQAFLEQMATTDPLTEVGNRRSLEEKLLITIDRLHRSPAQTSSIIVIDIDFFKRINDRYGHSCGDRVLKRFAQVVGKRIRKTDMLYRYGGEEFVVLLENTKIGEARELADELRQEIADSRWPAPDLKVTLSAGAAEYNGSETAYEWIERADMAMYDAKAQGRNCCRVA